MSNSDISPLGKALLAIGGAVTLGWIISELSEDDGSTRETHRSERKKGTSNKKYLIEVPYQPIHEDVTRLEQIFSEGRKYPNEYYTLTKAQQYKYRQKMAKELIQISSNE